jgi:hypothetical protein
MSVKINEKNYLPKSENSITHGLPNALYHHANNITIVPKAKNCFTFAYVLYKKRVVIF